jgi:hypothetical protein
MKKPRKIVVDGQSFLWRYTHGHLDGVCQDKLSIHPESGASLRVLFLSGEAGSTTTGEGWGGHVGGLLIGGRSYNLNRPALIAQIIKAALVSGWREQERGDFVVNGFELLSNADIQSCN